MFNGWTSAARILGITYNCRQGKCILSRMFAQRLLSYDCVWQSHYCIAKQSYIRVFGCQEEKHTWMTSWTTESSNTGPSASMLSYSNTTNDAKLLSDHVFIIVHSPCCSKIETNIYRYEHYGWIIHAHAAYSVKDAQSWHSNTHANTLSDCIWNPGWGLHRYDQFHFPRFVLTSLWANLSWNTFQLSRTRCLPRGTVWWFCWLLATM